MNSPLGDRRRPLSRRALPNGCQGRYIRRLRLSSELVTGLVITAALGGLAAAASDASRAQTSGQCGAGDSEPAWSRDGKRIAFQSDRGHPFRSSIFVARADGRSLRRVVDGRQPTWTRDNRILFVLPNGGLATVRPGLSSPQRIDSIVGSEPALSPTGREVAVIHDPGGYDLMQIVVSRLDGSGRRIVGEGINPASPSWSPNGRRLVFENFPIKRNHRGLYVVNADGTHLNQITRGRAVYQDPAWSPRAAKIALKASSSSRTTEEIFVINADGTRLRRLTKTPLGAASRNPAWSPDGKRIVFASNRANGPYYEDCFSVYVMRADGTALRRLTNPSK